MGRSVYHLRIQSSRGFRRDVEFGPRACAGIVADSFCRTHVVKAKGSNLPDTLAPALPLPVTAQLVNNENGSCFEATYATAIKNDQKKFMARTP
jgi:hypothetical protein